MLEVSKSHPKSNQRVSSREKLLLFSGGKAAASLDEPGNPRHAAKRNASVPNDCTAASPCDHPPYQTQKKYPTLIQSPNTRSVRGSPPHTRELVAMGAPLPHKGSQDPASPSVQRLEDLWEKVLLTSVSSVSSPISSSSNSNCFLLKISPSRRSKWTSSETAQKLPASVPFTRSPSTKLDVRGPTMSTKGRAFEAKRSRQQETTASKEVPCAASFLTSGPSTRCLSPKQVKQVDFNVNHKSDKSEPLAANTVGGVSDAPTTSTTSFENRQRYTAASQVLNGTTAPRSTATSKTSVEQKGPSLSSCASKIEHEQLAQHTRLPRPPVSAQPVVPRRRSSPTASSSKPSAVTKPASLPRTSFMDRSLSITRERSELERKQSSFRFPKDAKKTVCVCGASAYWERESVALSNERNRLVQDAARIQNEVKTLHELRDRVHSRLLDLEELETGLKSHTELLAAREAAADEETRRLAKLAAALKRERLELEQHSSQLMQRERDLEIQRRKHEKEALELREQISLNASETQRLRDLASRLTEKKADIEGAEDAVRDIKADCLKLQEELKRQKSALQAQQDASVDVKRKLSEDKERIKLREQALDERERSIEEREHEIEAAYKQQAKNSGRLGREWEALESRKRDLDMYNAKLNAQVAAFEAEKIDYEKQRASEREVWAAQYSKEKKELRDLAEAVDWRKKQYEETDAVLQAREQNLRSRDNALTASEESLQKREERIAQNEEQQQKNMVELDRLMTNVEKERASLLASRTELEEKTARLLAQQDALTKESDALKAQAQLLASRESQLAQNESDVKRLKAEMEKRDEMISSVEARSKWHQDVMKDILELKEQHALRVEEFELEKRSFAEMKASVMAAHDRKTAALRVREQSLASLEATLRTKQSELFQREKCLENRERSVLKSGSSGSNPFGRARRSLSVNSCRGTTKQTGSNLSAAAKQQATASDTTGRKSRPLTRLPSMQEVGDKSTRNDEMTSSLPQPSARDNTAAAISSAPCYKPPSRTVISKKQPTAITRVAALSLNTSTELKALPSPKTKPTDVGLVPRLPVNIPSPRAPASSRSAASLLSSPAFPMPPMLSSTFHDTEFETHLLFNKETDVPKSMPSTEDIADHPPASPKTRSPSSYFFVLDQEDYAQTEASLAVSTDPSFLRLALPTKPNTSSVLCQEPCEKNKRDALFGASREFSSFQPNNETSDLFYNDDFPQFPIHAFEALIAKDEASHSSSQDKVSMLLQNIPSPSYTDSNVFASDLA